MKYLLGILLVSLLPSCATEEKQIGPGRVISSAEVKLKEDLAAINLIHGQIRSTLSQYMKAMIGATSERLANEESLLKVAQKAQNKILKLTRLQNMKASELRAAVIEYADYLERRVGLDNDLLAEEVTKHQTIRENLADYYQNVLMINTVLPDVLEVVFSNESLKDFFGERATRQIANSAMAQIEQEMDVFFLLIEATREKNKDIQEQIKEVNI